MYWVDLVQFLGKNKMDKNEVKKNIWDYIGAIGTGLQGFSAPMLGDYQWGQKQQQLEAERQKFVQEQANQAAINRFLDGGMGIGQGVGITGGTIDLKTGETKLSMGLTPGAKSKQEVKTQVAKDAMGRVQKLQELIPVLDQFQGYMKAIPTGTGIEGRFQGLSMAASSPLQTNPFVATAMTQLDALRPQIARGFGDVGNLSKPEQENAKKFIPQVADNAETRSLKGLGGLTFIRNKITNAMDKSGLADDPDYLGVLNELDKRISSQFADALKLGIDGKQLSTFLGGANVKSSDIPMTKEIATILLQQSNGDKEKARKIAKDMGLKF